VENSVIAVQIANGTFVPVLNTSSRKRRRLVVTTVRDDQTDVRIKLYRGSDESMPDPQYIGTLIIDTVEPAESGVPDISVLLGVDESGNLNATATDTRSGEYQSLSVGLDQLAADGGYDIPDFQLSDEELTVDELSMDELSMDEEPEPAAASVSATPDASGDDEDDLDLDLDSLDAELAAESGAPAADDAAETGLPDLDEESGSEDFDGFADEDFSFDESLSFESELEDGSQQEDGSIGAEPSTEPDDLGGLDDLDLGALTDEETEEEEFGATEAAEGLVEAELGDEDFTFDESMTDELEDTLSAEEFDRLDSEPAPVEAESGEEPTLQPRRSNAIIFIGYVVLALAALGVLTYLVFRLLEGPAAPPLRAGLGENGVRAVALPVLALTGTRRRR